MKYEKELYYAFLMKIIDKYFPDISKKISKEGMLAPLTGRNIAMHTYDLMALYMLLCDIFGKEIKLHNVYSFWSIDAIATLLMEYEDERSRFIIQKELAT